MCGFGFFRSACLFDTALDIDPDPETGRVDDDLYDRRRKSVIRDHNSVATYTMYGSSVAELPPPTALPPLCDLPPPIPPPIVPPIVTAKTKLNHYFPREYNVDQLAERAEYMRLNGFERPKVRPKFYPPDIFPQFFPHSLTIRQTDIREHLIRVCKNYSLRSRRNNPSPKRFQSDIRMFGTVTIVLN